MSINKRIIKLRKKKNLSQREFAEFISVSKQTISNIENDKYNASTEVVGKILSKYPKVNSRWLILGEEDMFSEVPHQVNEDREPYGRNYQDKLIESLERENKMLREEISRLKKENI